MTGPRILLVLLAAALGAGAGWLFLLGGDEPETAAPPETTTTAEAPAEVSVPVAEEAVEQPARPVSLVPLPPDPIADRIAAGEKLYTLHGEVLDNVSGKPVKIYRSWLVPNEQSVHASSTSARKGRTWANPIGTFTYRGLEEGTYDLLIRVQGYEDLLVESIAVPPAEEKLSLTLSRGAYIEVAVNDFEGDGIGQLEVRLNPVQLDDPTKPGPRIRLRQTDDYGKALFTDLPSGTYTVAMGNAALAEYATQQFYLGVGQAYPVTFTVPTLNTVKVKAKDTNGNVLNLVQVRMWSKEGKGIFRAETDARGEAEIEHVPAGEYTVKLYKYGCRRKTETFNVESTAGGEVALAIELVHDPRSIVEEENPTKEQLERLKRGERPHEVFAGKGG